MIVLTALGLLGASGAAGTQVFPTRPVTLVVPFPRGGRATHWRVSWQSRCRKRSVNRWWLRTAREPQAALGSPGSLAQPHGYSLVLDSWVTHVVNGAVYALKYDVLPEALGRYHKAEIDR